MERAATLFPVYQTPILDVLRPVRVESWRSEGLFRCRGKYSPGARVGFIIRLRSQAFDMGAKNPAEAKGSGANISRDFIKIEKQIAVKRKFNVVDDPVFREIMIRMIVVENMPSARYVAKKAHIPWPQFVFDFNANIEKMMG